MQLWLEKLGKMASYLNGPGSLFDTGIKQTLAQNFYWSREREGGGGRWCSDGVGAEKKLYSRGRYFIFSFPRIFLTARNIACGHFQHHYRDLYRNLDWVFILRDSINHGFKFQRWELHSATSSIRRTCKFSVRPFHTHTHSVSYYSLLIWMNACIKGYIVSGIESLSHQGLLSREL